MIPHQLLHDEKYPFFDSFTRCPLFQTFGIRSCFQVLHRRGCSISVEIWMSAFRASGEIPSGPANFLDLRDLMALKISVLLEKLVLMSRSLLVGEMTGGTDGAGRLSVSLKYSAHRALCCFSPKTMFPFLSFIGRFGLLFLLKSDLIQALDVALAYSTLSFCSQFPDVRSFV